jgi:bacterioferritin
MQKLNTGERGHAMKGDNRMIESLNGLLSEELTAINEYMVHSEMCENWGYKKLNESGEKRAIVEMKHAEDLIARILFLEGMPIVSKLNKIAIGKDVEAQHKNDLSLEYDAIKQYNEAIKLAREVDDNGTRKMLEEILKDEEKHVDELETQLGQIVQMGIQVYLAEQI